MRHPVVGVGGNRSEEHTSELQSPCNLVSRLLLEKTYAPSDRKSTRLHASHLVISHAVFCLKKKNTSAFGCRGHLHWAIRLQTLRLAVGAGRHTPRPLAKQIR